MFFSNGNYSDADLMKRLPTICLDYSELTQESFNKLINDLTEEDPYYKLCNSSKTLVLAGAALLIMLLFK